MKEKIERILLGYSPPLSQANINEITEAIMVEWNENVKRLKAEQKKRESGKAKKLGSATK